MPSFTVNPQRETLCEEATYHRRHVFAIGIFRLGDDVVPFRTHPRRSSGNLEILEAIRAQDQESQTRLDAAEDSVLCAQDAGSVFMRADARDIEFRGTGIGRLRPQTR